MAYIHDNEWAYMWEDTINVLSYDGYYILEGIAKAQSYLDTYYKETTEPLWKKTGRLVWQKLDEGFKQSPRFGLYNNHKDV